MIPLCKAPNKLELPNPSERCPYDPSIVSLSVANMKSLLPIVIDKTKKTNSIMKIKFPFIFINTKSTKGNITKTIEDVWNNVATITITS